MTDAPGAEVPADDAMRRRVEELQRRRAGRQTDRTSAAGDTPTSNEPLAATAAAPSPSRAATRGRRSRPHVAKRARIGVAGIGFASMFAMVAAMGVADREAGTEQVTLVMTAPTTVAPPLTTPVVVVIHRPEPEPGAVDAAAAAAATDLAAAAPPGAAGSATASPGGAPPPPSGASASTPSAASAVPAPAAPAATAAPTAPPIELTAPPVVAPAPAPVATAPPTTPTSGSR